MSDFTSFHKVRGSLYIAWYIASQLNITHWPAPKLTARRDRNLQGVVRYAVETVPYYRDLFRQIGLSPAHIQTASDLAQLPILEKAQLQAEPERFVSESAAGRNALVMPSSGTSGKPIHIYQSRDYLLANTAYDLRHREVITQILGKGTPHRALSVVYPDNSVQRIRQYVRDQAFVPVQLARASRSIVSLFDPLETTIAAINHRQPNLLMAYGTFIELLFKTIRAQGLKMHIPKVIVYVSDHLTEDTQRMISEEYGAEVLSSYSAVEALRIGFTCPAGKGFHLHSDLTHVRVVDETGQDVPTGTPGDLVISNLTNRGTVLLNYRIGDRGRLAVETCPCGRTLPLLAKLEGRRDDVVALPNGQFLHSATVWAAIRHNLDILQYQLVQKTLTQFELKLVTADETTFAHASKDILASLLPVLGQGVSLTACYISPSAPFGSAKRSQLVSELGQPNELGQ